MRTILAWTSALTIGVALIASVALIVLTSLIHNSTESLASALESIRLAEELEVDLLLHDRATDPVIRERLADSVLDRLAEARQFVTSADAAEAFDAAVRHTDVYLAAWVDDPARSELYRTAFRAVDELVSINSVQSQTAQASARQWDRLANVVGTSAVISMIVVSGLLLWWLRSGAFKPLWHIARAMQAFARGDWSARAPEVGFRELRSVALRFNEMAAALADQRRSQMTFLGGVAHDLRNPLMALRMAVSTLARSDRQPPERSRKLLELVARQTTNLERMVGDLSDIAHVEAGELELRFEHRDLRDIVRESVAAFVGEAAAHPIALNLPEDPAVVHCDPLRVEQVVVNLISNAIKYSPKGSPIEVALALTTDGARFVVSVRDHGIGMTASETRRAFEPFTRFGPMKELVPGSGLGLYVVQKIALAHRGHIDVETVPRGGSTFRLYLPSHPAMRIDTKSECVVVASDRALAGER